jgi:predicted amidohydrolase YtcJ
MIEPRGRPVGLASIETRPMTRATSKGVVALAVLCAAVGTFHTVRQSLLAQTSAGADLVFANGKVVTVDDRFTIAQAIAVKGDRIVAVGSTQDMARLAGPGAKTIDLMGRTVIPGLIDNHLHLLRAGNTWELELRWDGIDSRKKAIEMLRARAKAVGPGGWVFNIGGWATAQFADDRKPFTLAELDAIAPENPVALQESYYQVFLNSRALKEFAIEAGKPDPSDFVAGSILRDAAGKPTGIIRGDIAATRPVAARMPKLAPERLEASTEALVKDVNRAGLTSFGVAGCNADVLEILRRWKAQNRLPVRVFCIGGAAAGSPDQVERSISQIAKMKLFTGDTYINDVVFGESVYTPLHDRMFATDSDPQPAQLEQWRRLAMEIAKARLPLHVHAELRDTIDAFLDQIEAVDKEYPVRNLRWALAHVNQINATQLERMKKLGMYAAVHPWAVINGAIMHEGFGDGANDMPPLATIQKSGITWGLGSDGTAANQYLPMTALSFAVTGRMAGGLKVMRQPIDREDALIAYTRKNAYFIFQEDNLGSIQAGKLADLVVLDRDYLTVPADQIKDIKPVMTVVGGRIVYE